jgi:hypothetical protein
VIFSNILRAMGIESIVGEAGKALFESESTAKLGAEFFKKDAEVLAGLGKLKTSELTESITGHLVREGRPGSAEYMGMFSKSCCLDKEFSLLEAGTFDPQSIKQAGLPLMVDAQQTTPEMIVEGKAVLTTETRADFLGSANTLKYKLEQHVGEAAQKASEYYADELTRETSVAERLKKVLGVKPKPYEIPFTPNEAELVRLGELSGLKFISREEAQQTFQRELHNMMKQRPGIIGLEGTASFSKFVGELSRELGGNPNAPVNVERLCNAHKLMAGRGAMEELQIYPEFGSAIEDGFERDFSQVDSAKERIEKVETIQGEVVFHNNEWLSDDIDDETKEWLNGNGHENIASEYSQTEQEQARAYSLRVYEQATGEANNSPGVAEVLKEVFDGEGNMAEEAQDASKLLLRIAVKAGAALAVSIARNIAKDKDTPQEIRIMMGVFADGLSKAGDFADKAIAGDANADLHEDIIAFITDKYN